MVSDDGLNKRILVIGLWLGASSGLGCRVPREVHEPREYPAIQIHASALELAVVDSRPPGTDPNQQQLSLPVDFEAKVQARLGSRLAGTGPAVRVNVGVAAADELAIVDARGEMTRVLVRLGIEIKPQDGVVLRRAETQSTSDLPRDEASAEEVAFVLDATALDAFDRYFADAHTLEGLNRELDAFAGRQ